MTVFSVGVLSRLGFKFIYVSKNVFNLLLIYVAKMYVMLLLVKRRETVACGNVKLLPVAT